MIFIMTKQKFFKGIVMFLFFCLCFGAGRWAAQRQSLAVSAVPEKKGLVAIVIDDFGYHGEGTDEILAIPIPLTVAIMPFSPEAENDYQLSIAAGKDIFIHLPMEAKVGKASWVGEKGIFLCMTDEEIKERVKEALFYFAEYGYERTSLSLVAEDIGIKKQSIYSHFRSKEVLFHMVMDQVLEEENRFVTDFFTQKKEPLPLLKEFILVLKTRFLSEEYVGAKFMLRNTFMPPIDFKESVIAKSILYFNHLENTIYDVFRKNGLSDRESRQNSQAFITILDGLLTGLIYADERRFDMKLAATWRLFERILTYA